MFNHWVGKTPWKRERQPTPRLGKFHGLYRPWSHKESDVTEWLSLHTIYLNLWTTALSNSMKLWTMPCRASQDRLVMVESSDKLWSTGEENGKSFQYSCLENPMNCMKWQKDRTLKDELPRSVGTQYATGDQWRTNSRKNKQIQSKNNTQLWMWLVMEEKSDAVKNNIA